MNDIKITKTNNYEYQEIAEFIAEGYFDDQFFKWVVPNDNDRMAIVTNYYLAYLGVVGAVSYIARNTQGTLVGATVWLPHDVDASVYEEIDAAAGIYAANFDEVASKSHANEPTSGPFFQLVAVVTKKSFQNQGIGYQLLKHFIDQLDEENIATYLEASTPYNGGGVYGKFGYDYFGELMHFAPGITLYPLYRSAGGNAHD